MQSVIKHKKFILLGIEFILLPVIVPLLATICNVIFSLGVELGTNIRYILNGFSC